jgi:hypothetical protein
VKVPKDQPKGPLRIEVRFDSGPLRGEVTGGAEVAVVEGKR